MNTYRISYTFKKNTSNSRTETQITQKGETESDAKNAIMLKHASKDESVIQWRKVVKI